MLFLLYMSDSWAGKLLVPSVTTIYSTLQPIFTCFISYFVLYTILTINEVFGGIFIIIGLLMTVYGRYREETDLRHLNGHLHISNGTGAGGAGSPYTNILGSTYKPITGIDIDADSI